MFEPCDVLERLGHFDGIVPSLVCIPTKQHIFPSRMLYIASAMEIPLENPWKRHFGTQELVRVPKPPSIHCQPAT